MSDKTNDNIQLNNDIDNTSSSKNTKSNDKTNKDIKNSKPQKEINRKKTIRTRQGKRVITIRQEKFINEYIINGGNGTQAAVKAGYSKKTANVIATQNLNKLSDIIQERLGKKNANKVAKSDEVLELLTIFARGEMKEEQIIVEGSGNGYSEARIMQRKIANKDQLQALDKLARIHGLYNDRLEVSQKTNETGIIESTLNALKTRSFEEEDEE